MKKIAILVCFIGKPHNYFGLFLKTVACNPTIDFILLGHLDGLENYTLPANVKVVEMPLERLEAIMKERLQEPTLRIDSPYKTGDFRPMFGETFERDLLQGYDEWGYCDLDLVFGDMRKFLTDERLDTYDKIYPLGHFSLFKNTLEVNRRWRLPDARYDYHEVIASSEVYAFEEWRGIYNIYMRNKFPFFRTVEYLSPSVSIRPRYRLESRSDMRYERNPVNYWHQCFYWENGRVYRAYRIKENGKPVVKAEEYIYMHFQCRSFPMPTAEVLEASAGFFCSPQGFFLKKTPGVPTPEEVDQYNPMMPLGIVGEIGYLMWRSMKRWSRRTWTKVTGFGRTFASRDTQIRANRNWD